jgi:signal transduction histidine kinase
MASVVSREIYGPLTGKQKEYVEIIQNSGRYLLSIVNEISELGSLNDSTQTLNLTSVDIEMLCQQVLNTLSDAANRREQLIRLSVEPGRSRIWVLDKDKIRQLLYHLVFSVIQAATTGSIICIHISHKDYGLNLAVSVSHPWLGDGLTQVDPYFGHLPVPVVAKEQSSVSVLNKLESQSEMVLAVPAGQPLELSISSSDTLATELESELAQPNSSNCSGESLRLVISCHLAQLHGGQISIQGTPESGYRYVVSLPELTAVEESL